MTEAEVLGTSVAAVALAEAADELERWIRTGTRSYACLANVHVIETARRSPEVAESLRRAGLVLADGAPVAWFARRVLGRHAARVTGSDIFEELCRRSAGTYRHYFFGSTPETLAGLEAAVRERFPGVVVCGSHAPPFRPLSYGEQEAVVRTINEARPDIVWIGLGAPKQELWMAWARELLDAPVLAGIGAVFDFASGRKARAPRLVQRLGLEWLHRLASEPRRLARRYLVTNSSFVLGATRSLLVDERGGVVEPTLADADGARR
jgi:N-acetylglucosaminyldiphosphoundecaprenol N-acetyl-beta-D-mannosaminyltransferase